MALCPLPAWDPKFASHLCICLFPTLHGNGITLCALLCLAPLSKHLVPQVQPCCGHCQSSPFPGCVIFRPCIHPSIHRTGSVYEESGRTDTSQDKGSLLAAPLQEAAGPRETFRGLLEGRRCASSSKGGAKGARVLCSLLEPGKLYMNPYAESGFSRRALPCSPGRP